MRQNVAGQFIGAQMVSASDGSAFTGTVSAFVTVNGGTQGAGGGAVTHKGNGYHSYALTQAETNAWHVAVTFTGTGAVPATSQTYPGWPQSGDAFLRLGVPASAVDISADIAAVAAKTANLPSDPADASVLQAQIAGVETKVDTGNTAGAAVKVTTDKLATMVEVDGAVYRYTTNALEQAPVGGGGGGDATSAKQDTIIAKVDAVKAETAAIKAETATIVAKTAQLKFTVTNTVDTNITHVKGGAVSGTGQPGAEWGPT